MESSNNPADVATRGLNPKDLAELRWLNGPESLQNASEISIPGVEQAILSADDPEVRKELRPLLTSATSKEPPTMGTDRFKRYSSWSSLRRAIAILIDKVRSLKERNIKNKGRSQHGNSHHLSPEVIT